MTPQLLRPASEREEAWAELQEDQPIPWTFTSILGQGRKKVHDDLTHIPPPTNMEVDEEDEPELIPEPPPPPRHRHRRKGPEPEVPPSKHPRLQDQEDDILMALSSPTPATHLEEENGCILVSIDLPTGKQGRKGMWMRDLGAYIVRPGKTMWR